MRRREFIALVAAAPLVLATEANTQTPVRGVLQFS